MFVNVLLVLLVAAVAVLFGWLARRALSAGNPFLKWIGFILSSLLTLVISLVAIVAAVGMVKMYASTAPPAPDLKVEGTPEQIARGQHIADAFCTSCHSTNSELPLTGGLDLGADIPMPLGKFVSVNLTPAGPLKDYTDGEIFRALRHSVDEKGRRLVIMSSNNVRYMSDDDMHALIAYLRSTQPAENETLEPPDQVTLLGFIMAGAGLIPEKPPVTAPIIAPEKTPTADYGKFMITFLDCTDCHGEDLSGGTNQFAPKGPSLRAVKGWTLEQFMTTLRTGITPAGEELKPPMPWKSTGRLDDVELTALYEYIVSLP